MKNNIEDLPLDDARRVITVGNYNTSSESRETIVRVDLRGLFNYELKDDAHYRGRDHLTKAERRYRCEQLLLRRLAERVANAHSLLGYIAPGFGHSPTGRWFPSGGVVIHVCDAYLYALVLVRHTFDC